jgi:L-fucose isomerase-like protein
MKPKVVIVPFGDRFYPQDLLDGLIERSINMVAGLGVDLVTTQKVNSIPDAQAVARQLEETPCDLIIGFISCWMEPVNFITALKNMFHKPILLWSLVMFPAEEGSDEMITTGAFVAAAVLRETMEEMGVQHKFTWGMPEKKEVQKEIAGYARVAQAKRRLSETRIGLFGYPALGIYTATADHVSLRQKIGPEIHHMDQWLIIKGMEEVSEAEAAEFAADVRRHARIAPDVTQELLLKGGRMAVALRKLGRENQCDALNVKCHYELSEWFQFTACVPLSFLSREFVCSCEGDLMASATQLMLHYLTDNQTVYGDIHEVFSDRLTFSCCGLNPIGMCDPSRCLISRYNADFQGISNSSPYVPGQRVTVARLAARGDDYKMHITTGVTTDTFNWHEVNCPPPPATDVILDDDAMWFAKNIASNHYGMVYGDVREQLIDLCEMLGVRVVTYPGK